MLLEPAAWRQQRRRLTVELIEADERERAFLPDREQGLPVVPGEYAHHGGYHHHPTGDGYQHFLLHPPTSDQRPTQA